MTIESATAETRTKARTRIPIRVTVNGRDVEATVGPNDLLLDFLRDDLDLKGAKRSCDVQVCGSCTVLMDGLPVSSCCTLAYEADGREITTIEGLAVDGRPHPLQNAFVEHTAIQCGFCTSGMILTAKWMLEDVPDPTPEQIRHALEGNLCRCTGYWNIIRAVQEAARVMAADDGKDDEA